MDVLRSPWFPDSDELIGLWTGSGEPDSVILKGAYALQLLQQTRTNTELDTENTESATGFVVSCDVVARLVAEDLKLGG